MSQLRKRQTVALSLVDDQSPALATAFSGVWFNLNGPAVQGYINDTLSFTNTTGSTIHFTFAGTQAWFYGALRNGTYPQADYTIDGISAGAQSPYVDTSNQIIYFQTPMLSSNTHTITVNVTVASNNSPYYLDAILFAPLNGAVISGAVVTQTVMPTNSTTSSSKTNLGGILGGVFGGLAFLVALGLLVFFWLRRRRNHNYYFDEPNTAEILGPEADAEVQPFPHSPPPSSMRQTSPFASTFGYADLNSQAGSGSSDVGASVPMLAGSSNRTSLQPSEIGSSSGARPMSAKAAMMARVQSQNEPQPIQHADSGIRFVQNAVEEPVAAEVPPSYSAT